VDFKTNGESYGRFGPTEFTVTLKDMFNINKLGSKTHGKTVGPATRKISFEVPAGSGSVEVEKEIKLRPGTGSIISKRV
jgi:hypothetical protein